MCLEFQGPWGEGQGKRGGGPATTQVSKAAADPFLSSVLHPQFRAHQSQLNEAGTEAQLGPKADRSRKEQDTLCNLGPCSRAQSLGKQSPHTHTRTWARRPPPPRTWARRPPPTHLGPPSPSPTHLGPPSPSPTHLGPPSPNTHLGPLPGSGARLATPGPGRLPSQAPGPELEPTAQRHRPARQLPAPRPGCPAGSASRAGHCAAASSWRPGGGGLAARRAGARKQPGVPPLWGQGLAPGGPRASGPGPARARTRTGRRPGGGCGAGRCAARTAAAVHLAFRTRARLQGQQRWPEKQQPQWEQPEHPAEQQRWWQEWQQGRGMAEKLLQPPMETGYFSQTVVPGEPSFLGRERRDGAISQADCTSSAAPAVLWTAPHLAAQESREAWGGEAGRLSV
ncbi:caskin-1-like [Equus przewalskii]|uniref:Caskin-1-like n=1 Tax=Equus przewalskii TaxID=9798 RepID=A0ABM4JN07_EQUPR